MCGAASPWETRLHQPGGSEHVAKRGQHRYRRPGFGGLPLPGGLSTAPGLGLRPHGLPQTGHLGPIQVGSEFDAAERVPFKAVTHSRITALEPGSWVAWHAWWSGGVRLIGNSYCRRAMVARIWCSAPRGTLPSCSVCCPGLSSCSAGDIPVENRRSLERIKANLEEGVRASTPGAGLLR